MEQSDSIVTISEELDEVISDLKSQENKSESVNSVHDQDASELSNHSLSISKSIY